MILIAIGLCPIGGTIADGGLPVSEDSEVNHRPLQPPRYIPLWPPPYRSPSLPPRTPCVPLRYLPYHC